jgi:hypothetical protein
MATKKASSKGKAKTTKSAKKSTSKKKGKG